MPRGTWAVEGGGEGSFAVTGTKVQMPVVHTLGKGPPILWSPLNLGIFIYEMRRRSIQILRIKQADVSDSLMHGGKLLSPSQKGARIEAEMTSLVAHESGSRTWFMGRKGTRDPSFLMRPLVSFALEAESHYPALALMRSSAGF